MKRSIIAPALMSGLALAVSLSALGAGGGGGGGGGGGDSEVVSQDPDFRAGMDAVRKQDWVQVVARMSAYAQRRPGDADAWNELGHAKRRLGDMDAAFRAYARALQIDPKHKGAHEYLGEAYLQVGDLARAEQELKALDSICWLPCEQYSDLKAEIARYKNLHAQPRS